MPRATPEELLATVPRPGDRRYPTVASVGFIVILFGAIAIVLHVWQGWWWTYIVYVVFLAYYAHVNLATVRFERARARVAEELRPEAERVFAEYDALFLDGADTTVADSDT